MGDSSKSLLIAVSYSLPHVISASVSIIFNTYLVILYINTYKWKAEDFGKAYALHFLSISIAQLTLALVLQYVFISPDEVTGLRNCKIAQIINASAHSGKRLFNIVSMLFLVVLPILKIRYNNKINTLEDSQNAVKNADTTDTKQSITWKIYNTKWFFYIISMLCAINGFGFGSYEINNRLIPTYLVKDSTYLSSTNDLIKRLSILSTVFIIILLNKLVKGKYPDYIPYLGLTIILLVLLTPISTLFYVFTQKTSTSSYDPSNYVPTTANLDYPVLAGLVILETVHGIYYLTCPIIIQYVSTHFLDDDSDFRIHASTLYLVFYFLGSVIYKAFSDFITLPKKIVSYLCFVCYITGYFLVFPYRYSWNKNGILYYFIIAIHNIFIMIAIINTNIMITNQMADDNHKKYRWIVQGCIYCVKNIIIYFFMRFIYKIYDKEHFNSTEAGGTAYSPPISSLCAKGTHDGNGENLDDKRWIKHLRFKLNFRNFFIMIFLTCQVTGIIATAIYKEHIFE